MSTGMIAALLLANRHGISERDLIDKYDWLAQLISERGGRADFFRETPTSKVVDRAIKLIGSEILSVKHHIVQINSKSSDGLSNINKLALYRNQIPHVFYTESLVACAFYALEQKGEKVTESSLLEHTSFLATILNVEFHVMPDPKNTIDFSKVLQTMCSRKLLNLSENSISIVPGAEETYFFFCSLLWPFIDAYWAAAVTLYSLLPCNAVDEARLLDRTTWLTEKLFHDGVLVHFDACSKEIMRNAITVFKDTNVLSFNANGDYHLAEPFWKKEENVTRYVQRISLFRKLPLSRKPSYTRKNLVAHFPNFLSKI